MMPDIGLSGHRKCRLGIKDFTDQMYSKSPIVRQALRDNNGELWFVRNGLLDEAGKWLRSTSVHQRHTIMDKFPPELLIVVALERPWIVDGYSLNGWAIHRPAGEEKFRLGFASHFCKGMAYAIDDDVWTEGTKGALFMAAMAVRMFALQPATARPTMDVDVFFLEKGRGRVPIETIPTSFVIRWRRRPPSTRTDGPHTNVDWSHRWLVRAHLRQLASGRIVPVREHIKGPDDRPLVLKDRVNALVR